MLVWVASFPRSGNNLCLMTLSEAFGATTGSVLDPDPLISRLSLDPDVDLRAAVRESSDRVFLKTHRLPGPNDGDPAIYLVRDGRDSLVSYAHFMQAQRHPRFESLSFEKALAKLIERKDHPYGSWSANVRSWTRREAPTKIVRFERLIEDPVGTMREAVTSLGMALPEQRGQLPTFDELHERNPKIFRRGKVGSWRSEFPARLEERFWELHGAEMLAMGYRRA